MKTIKWIIAAVLLGTMASCGYNVKSDNELRTDQYARESLESELQDLKIRNQIQTDTLRMNLILLQSQFKHYQDSVAFMELARVMCYQNDKHRHSCEIYK